MHSSGTGTGIMTGSAHERPVLAVDDRQDPRFTRALGSVFDVRVKHLPTGDLVWSSPLGVVGVEDKCLNDLKSSRANGRLDDELRRLVERYDVPILFVRGHEVHLQHSWPESSYSNLMLKRQLHGVFTWRSYANDFDEQAVDLLALYKHLNEQHEQGLNGVKRERHIFSFVGPMGDRAEAIYGILGRVGGVRDRRSVAYSIAKVYTLTEFLRWDMFEAESFGFSKHMAIKLVQALRAMEAK